MGAARVDVRSGTGTGRSVQPLARPRVWGIWLALLFACGLGAPLSAREETVVIGSKNFTESWILAEMMRVLIEEHTELGAEHRSNLGGTLICFTALVEGEIDLYADYTGTGWSVLLQKQEKIGDRLKTFLQVQERCRALYDVEWLQPFGPNNTYALAMNADRARELGIESVSELVPHASELRAGFSIEFMNRADGYAGLVPFYGLELGDVKSMEHGLAYEALATGAVDLVDAYSTDGRLLRYDLRILKDDRGFFPPYDAAPLLRGQLLRTHPELRAVLERLAFRISDERMMELNYQVEVEGRRFEDVAREYLRSEGLLQRPASAAELTRRSGLASREILSLVWEHILLTLKAVFLATLIGVPVGIAITRSLWGERLALGLAGIVQTIPSLALLVFMIAIPGLGLSANSAVAALTLYAILPILRNTFSGMRAVEPETIDAARGIGLTERQVLLRVQLPLATGTIMAGIRTASVITVGFATLAAFIGAGGLGEPILTGLTLNDYGLILSGALPAALLALTTDALLGRLERIVTPRGLLI